jgi:hypothetical protein
MKAAIISAILFATSTTLADPSGGPMRGHGLIQPGSLDSYAVSCHAREVTAFRVVGDGDGDIDCCVYDGGGHQIDCDQSSRDGCYLTVTPAWTDVFTLVLVNRGRLSSAYDVKVW